MANLGVPVKLLHESLGHIITVELKTGEVGLKHHIHPPPYVLEEEKRRVRDAR